MPQAILGAAATPRWRCSNSDGGRKHQGPRFLRNSDLEPNTGSPVALLVHSWAIAVALLFSLNYERPFGRGKPTSMVIW